MIEISRYNENFPQSVNETISTEYSISLADGNIYKIEKERQGYIIKMAINESNSHEMSGKIIVATAYILADRMLEARGMTKEQMIEWALEGKDDVF